jgi:hypothetical protein
MAGRGFMLQAALAMACVFLLAFSPARAADDPAHVYSQFEADWLSNAPPRVGAWMADDLEYRQTIHLFDRVADSAKIGKAQLLAGMEKVTRASPAPAAKAEDILIEPMDNGRFCATASAHYESSYNGAPYTRKDIRRACFRQADGSYLVYDLALDVYFGGKGRMERSRP